MSKSCVESGHSGDTLRIKESFLLRPIRRLPLPPIYPRNETILTAFAAASFISFLVIYLEVSRLLIPDTVLTLRDLRHLTKGFANDMPFHEHPDHRKVPLHLSLQRKKPSAIVIGFSHCGANEILDDLTLHPDVIVNRESLHFFDLDGGNHTEQWYISKMPFALPHHTTVDVCLDCIQHSNAINLIKAYDKRIKIIIVVCHPLERLLMYHLNNYFMNKKINPFEFNDNNNNDDNSNTMNYSNSNGIYTEHTASASTTNNIRRDTATGKSKSLHTLNQSAPFNNDHPANSVNKLLQRSTRDTATTSTSSSSNSTTDLLALIISRRTKLKSKLNQIKTDFENVTNGLRKRVLLSQSQLQLERGQLVNESDENSKTLLLNTSFLNEMGNLLKPISRVFSQFLDKQVHVIDKDTYFSHEQRGAERLRIFRFLRVKPQNDFHHNRTRKEGKINSNSSNKTSLSTQDICRILREREDTLFQQLEKFYTSYSERLFVYLKKHGQV